MAPKSDLGGFAFYCAPGALRAELKAGADPNVADLDTGTTPLMWLCEMLDRHTKSRKRMFRLLVSAGASLTATDIHGQMACHYAAYGASRSFKHHVFREYRRILGRVPKKQPA